MRLLAPKHARGGEVMALSSLQAKALNAKRQSMYTPEQLTQGARNGRRAKLLATVDPTGTLDEAERNRRADALLKAQMLALTVARENKRKAAKTQAANEAIRAIAHPATGCAYCRPLQPHESHKTCPTHANEMKQRLGR